MGGKYVVRALVALVSVGAEWFFIAVRLFMPII